MDKDIEIIDFGNEQTEEKISTPILDMYGEDLTAKTYVTNPAIAREEEIKKLMVVILTPDKSALLVGKAGIGKTAIVEELANRIKKNDVPDKLIGYKILAIDMGSLVAGTKYRGEFEEKLKNLIDSIIDSKIILFIDEIHTMVNAGGADGAINAADILKPYWP